MPDPDTRPARVRATRRLRPAERLRAGSEYRQVYENATVFHGRALVLFVRREEGLRRRAGFVAGRRVGGAVQRNRARRVLKEGYRSLKNSLPEQGLQLVLVARPPCANLRMLEVARELRDLLLRAGVLRQ